MRAGVGRSREVDGAALGPEGVPVVDGRLHPDRIGRGRRCLILLVETHHDGQAVAAGRGDAEVGRSGLLDPAVPGDGREIGRLIGCAAGARPLRRRGGRRGRGVRVPAGPHGVRRRLRGRDERPDELRQLQRSVRAWSGVHGRRLRCGGRVRAQGLRRIVRGHRDGPRELRPLRRGVRRRSGVHRGLLRGLRARAGLRQLWRL